MAKSKEEREAEEQAKKAAAEAEAAAAAEAAAKKRVKGTRGMRYRIPEICSLTLRGEQIRPAKDGLFDLTDEQFALAVAHGLEIEEVKRTARG